MDSGEGDTGASRLALVTGASRGIGEAFAQVLAEQGYRLVIVARSEGELNRVSGVLGSKYETTVVPLRFDLCEPHAGAALASELEGRGLRPDVIVNNAGFGLLGPAAELPLEDQLEMIDVNVRVLTELSLRFLPAMLAGEGRRGIINIASLASLLPCPNMAVYFAAKAYVLSFSEALAAEVRGRGVTVTAVCPGVVPTGFQARAGMEHCTAYKFAPRKTASDVAEAGWAGFQRGERVVLPGATKYLMDDVIVNEDLRMLRLLLLAVVAAIIVQAVTSFLLRRNPSRRVLMFPASARGWEGLLRADADLVLIGGGFTNPEVARHRHQPGGRPPPASIRTRFPAQDGAALPGSRSRRLPHSFRPIARRHRCSASPGLEGHQCLRLRARHPRLRLRLQRTRGDLWRRAPGDHDFRSERQRHPWSSPVPDPGFHSSKGAQSAAVREDRS